MNFTLIIFLIELIPFDVFLVEFDNRIKGVRRASQLRFREDEDGSNIENRFVII